MRWIALALIVGCGPNVGSDSESASEDDTGTASSGSSSSAADTSTGTSTTSTTADPTVMSSVSTVDPDSSATVLPETEGVTDCLGGGGPNALGDACGGNADCASGVCRTFSDAPPDPDRYCAEAPEDCSTVVTATVWRLPPGDAGVPDVNVRVLKALEAITNPAGADPVFEATSDAAGRIDGVTEGPVSAAIAILAVTGGDANWYPTATGLASEVSGAMYEVGTPVHDLWAMPTATLDAINVALAADPTVPDEYLPVGDAGGVIGVVRDGGGTPIVGAVVEPTLGGSSAIIRYLTDEGSVDTTGTHGSGAFIVLGATVTGEDFAATLEGAPLAGGTAGSAPGLVFALVMTAV